MGEDTAPHPHRWAMLAGVWMVYFCFGSTAAAIAPLVSRITAELDLNQIWQMVDELIDAHADWLPKVYRDTGRTTPAHALKVA